MRSESEANRALALYADMVRRICFVHLKRHADVEDVFQDVFLKYMLHERPFESDAHEKAWLIRVAINASKDSLRSYFRRRTVPLDDALPTLHGMKDEDRQTLEAVMQLPKNYRDAIYLHYYEGYSAVEIAKLLHKNENTIYTRLSRAKTMLRRQLGGDGR